MLEFITGRAGSGKTTACLQAVCRQLAQDPSGPALLLLLPEHATYKAERRLAAMTSRDGGGFMRAMVFGFRRFARQVLLETGGGVYPRITEIGRRLLLKKILDRHQKELTVFARAARQRGFTDALSDAIEEFKSYGASPQRLGAAAAVLADTNLQHKMQELALLYEDFSAGMKGRYNDAEDMLATLAERLPESALADGAEVWVDGFVFFNPQEQAVLRVLLQKAAAVHVALTLDESNVRENIPDTGLFHRSWQTMRQLQDMADELGIPWRVRAMQGKWRYHQEALAVVEQGLFSFQPAAGSEAAGGVRIVEAATRRLEVEAAAADMIRLCREEGCHWRDIGLLVRNREDYGTLLELVLQDYGIPFFSDSQRQRVHHPLAELVRSAFEVLHGWRYDAVFRCIKTDFFPITQGQADLLENYVLQFGIRGRRWTMDEDWSYQRHFSLEEEDSELSDADSLYLRQINQIRRQVAMPLHMFEQAVRKATDVRGITTALYEFLTALEVPETLQSWAQRAEKDGRLVEAREHQAVWEDIVELMEQLVETSGDESMGIREYEAVLDDGLDGLTFSLIPPGLDYVTLASFDQNSLDNARAVYVLGANEGVMPRRSRESGLLSDADRLHLMEAGLELPAGALESSFSENYLLYRGFTLSRDYLWVSYALADAEGTGLHAAPLLGRLRRLLPKADFLSIPLESIERQDSLLLAEGHQAVSGLAAALRGYRERRILAPFWQDVYNWALQCQEVQNSLDTVIDGLFAHADEEKLPAELAARLYTKKRRLRGSVTRFESFRACPFRHFAQYGLRLKEREAYRFQAPGLGTLLHGALRVFGERLKKEKRRWREVSDDECHVLCEEIVQQLAPKLQNEILLSSAQYQNFLLRIRETAERSILRLIAFDHVSGFQPVAFERSFGMGPDSMPPLLYALDEKYKLEITGQIDRLDQDETGRYFLIIDYKTGHAYMNLIEVYYGLRLQLLTYLLVAQNLMSREGEGDVLPAGMLYCFLQNPLVEAGHRLSQGETQAEIRKRLRMPGWVLAEPEVIREIDSSLSFIRVSLKKDGSIYQSSRGSVRTPEEFQILLDYIACVLQDTGRDILSGEVAARPYRLGEKDACKYCVYRAVCGFDLQVPGYGYRQLAPHEDAELMDAMEIAGQEGKDHAMV